MWVLVRIEWLDAMPQGLALEVEGLDEDDRPDLAIRGRCRSCGAITFQRDLTVVVRARRWTLGEALALTERDHQTAVQHHCATIERG